MGERKAVVDDLIVSAAELFNEHGYGGTSVSQILNAVKLSKGGLYHRIQSKAELLYLTLCYACDNLHSRIMTPVSKIPDPEEQLRTQTRLHLESILTGRGMFAVPSAEADVLPEDKREEIRAMERRYVDFVRDILARLAPHRPPRDVSLRVAAFNHLGMILHVMHWYRPQGPLSLDEIAEHITRTTMTAISEHPADPPLWS